MFIQNAHVLWKIKFLFVHTVHDRHCLEHQNLIQFIGFMLLPKMDKSNSLFSVGEVFSLTVILGQLLCFLLLIAVTNLKLIWLSPFNKLFMLLEIYFAFIVMPSKPVISYPNVAWQFLTSANTCIVGQAWIHGWLYWSPDPTEKQEVKHIATPAPQ